MKKGQDDEDNKHMYLQYKNVKLSDKCVKLENCGEGGFGTVDAYYDHNLQKVIAVKKVSRYTTYLQEKRRLINMKKKQFEFVNDLIGFCDDERILMFELGEATLLEIDDEFQDDGYIWREIDLIYIAWNLLVGLKYLRDIKSYHGDISPNNVMFFMDKVKYIDLGSSEIGKNASYLQQYKMEFVNHEIRKNRQNFKYSDDDITQNEMYTLGKTILYLALSNQADKNTFIMDIDKKSQKVLIEQQKNHFYQLVFHEDLSLNYPKLKNILLKLMYPFEDIPGKEQHSILNKKPPKSPMKNNQNIDDEDEEIDDNFKYKEPKKVKKAKLNDESGMERNGRKFQKVLQPMIAEDEVKENGMQTIEMKTINIEQQTVELGTIALQTSDNQMDRMQDYHDEEEDEDEEDSDYGDDDDNKKKMKMNNKKARVQDILDELVTELTLILSEYNDRNNFSKVIEESNEIKVALFKIRMKRVDELLGKHDDPQRELVYLSTLSEQDWRKEIAQSMIQDVLNSQANTGINKYDTQRMIHEKILRIQKRIVEKRIEIEDQFVDAIKDLYNICKKNKEYHSLIECIYSLYLIYHFLALPDEAAKQLESAHEKINFHLYAGKYADTLTKKKICESKLNNINQIAKLVDFQLNQLRTNNYDIIY